MAHCVANDETQEENGAEEIVIAAVAGGTLSVPLAAVVSADPDNGRGNGIGAGGFLAPRKLGNLPARSLSSWGSQNAGVGPGCARHCHKGICEPLARL